MVIFILSLLIFLVFGGVVSAIILGQQSEKRKRLLSVVQGGVRQSNKNNKKNSAHQRRTDLSRKLKETGSDKPNKKGVTLPRLLIQAGMSISAKQFWINSIICCVVVTFLAKIMGFSAFIVAMAFIIGLLGLPRMVLRFRIKRRQKQFMDDFADALEAMMRLLKAGMPVSEAIKMVAREFTGPMSEEMDYIFNQQKIGVSLPDAVLESARRMPLTEMQMFATAIAIQTQTGSSLSEILQNLANVIRARYKLRRKVQAFASEAKASAMIIGSLPVIVSVGMFFLNREYMDLLFYDPTGQFLLGCAIGSMTVGSLVMRQMINFKV